MIAKTGGVTVVVWSIDLTAPANALQTCARKLCIPCSNQNRLLGDGAKPSCRAAVRRQGRIGGSSDLRTCWPSRPRTATATCRRATGKIRRWPSGSSTAAASGSWGVSLRIGSSGSTRSVSPGPCGRAASSLGIGMPWWPSWKRSTGTTGTATSRNAWPRNRELAAWLHGVRCNKRSGRLDADRVRQLDALGVVWEPQQTRWENMFAALVEYRQRHGDCNVPCGWPENPALAKWVKGVRAAQKRGDLDLERIRRLDAIGFGWERGGEWRWEEMYAELADYQQRPWSLPDLHPLGRLPVAGQLGAYAADAAQARAVGSGADRPARRDRLHLGSSARAMGRRCSRRLRITAARPGTATFRRPGRTIASWATGS